MRILQVCLKPPYPKVDGGCVAMAAMTESLLEVNNEVKTICVSTHKHPFEQDKIPTDLFEKTGIEAVEIDTRLKPFDALKNLFTDKSYNVQRFYNKNFEQRLTELLEEREFDIIHLESIFCTPYLDTIRSYSKAKVIVRTHNIEFKIWEHLAANEANPLKKLYLNLLASRLKQYELDVLKRIDGIVAITDNDKKDLIELGVNVPSTVIPIGIRINDIKILPTDQNEISLYHLGAMDWLPNVEGIHWFLEKIWPRISQEFSQIKCFIAGRGMPPSILSKSAGNLHVQGEVSSVSHFISDKNVAVIPLVSGSGMRVKIVEALAHGKAVITTSLGATGIPYETDKDLLVANSPEEFVEKIRMLNNDKSLITAISKKARKLAEREFDLSTLSSKLTYFYANL